MNFSSRASKAKSHFCLANHYVEPNITPEQILDATEACAMGVEIVASRIADWRIKLVDTIADNASYGGFTLGPWDKQMENADLGALAMTIHHNGELAAEGLGSAALGHPATSTAWLANKLARVWRFAGTRRYCHLRRHHEDDSGQSR